MICYRKSLPCLGDNTSNRVERSFWTLKKAVQDTFITLPKTMKAAVFLVKFIDKRLEEKYIFASNKVLIIHDENILIRDLNVQASKSLNDRGFILFHAAQKRLEDVACNLSVNNEGQMFEQFLRGFIKTYKSTPTNCNCSFASTHQAPCAHVLFLRTENSIEVFAMDLFHQRYHHSASDNSTFLSQQFNVEREDEDDVAENSYFNLIKDEGCPKSTI